LVCKENFKDYFGPFAAQAFRQYKTHINKTTFLQQTALPGIGSATATKVMKERTNGDFASREDFCRRLCNLDPTQIVTYLESFVFPEDMQNDTLDIGLPQPD
jgi:DNA polymerase III alpha subunit (gram-positive type)